ncbi:hypothetical protein [Legionella hackeliae]|uniref:Glycosyltransferase RgtA/B/C/D-like domain-containing protein n=1 Tax=Legionella hackeliae TaxID=449 RepID=A0A0A8UNV2_LEGHA|nr:hypothetical protein [Legionella hackeliae]KTD13834.1 hypothetical protein Lhac_0678 [Legionella hackeliae]CEK10535.1 conserved membrane protein of unknown function [Legionella hackeliae]STX47273.1 Uncharacterised protein [Legionella hackeliae]
MTSTPKRIYYLIPSLVLIFAIIIEWLLILSINHSHFSYSLDDPYIHLSLAKHIGIGQYGFNNGEFSSPSSSILWPFLLAPFSYFPLFEFVPLIINSLIALLILLVFITVCLFVDTEKTKVYWENVVLFCLLIPALNLIGLIFSGMEHALQMLLSVLIMAGLIQETNDHRFPLWLALVIIIGPLIRYETLAISVPALFFLFIRGHQQKVLYTTLIMLVMLGLFSLFLLHIGQPPLAASVLLKMDHGQYATWAEAILGQLRINLTQRQSLIFLILIFSFSIIAIFSKLPVVTRQLFAVVAAGLLLHLLLGKFNWFHRYEVYLYAVALLLIFYLYFKHYHTFKNPTVWYVFFVLGLIFCSYPYFTVLASLPKATNNVYQQQFQMRRFAIDWLKSPIAVNDIGWVSYDNSNYVLDLWGLGNYSIYSSRCHATNPLWMDKAVKESQVKLVMLYRSWFYSVPKNWIQLGCLYFTGPRVSVANKVVYFYATDLKYVPELQQKLHSFSKSLPQNDGFKFDCK